MGDTEIILKAEQDTFNELTEEEEHMLLGETEEGAKNQETEGEGEGQEKAAEEEEIDTREVSCPKCSQVYAGPDSLTRHLWRIHRLSMDEAKPLVEKVMAKLEGREMEEDSKPEEGKEEENKESKEETSNTEDAKPLMATTPKVTPLLSLEPPSLLGEYGGMGLLPGAPSTGLIPGGGQGLLPTPGTISTGPKIESACLPSSEPGVLGESPSEGEEKSPGKIPSLMSLNPIMGKDGQEGIRPLMSIPMIEPPGMGRYGMGYYPMDRYRMRQDRRPQPYYTKRNQGTTANSASENNGANPTQEFENQGSGDASFNAGEEGFTQSTESFGQGAENFAESTDNFGQSGDGYGEQQAAGYADPYAGYSEEGGYWECSHCGNQFETQASLADHEPCAQSVSIDLNCDV